jgi:hypothetical protein
LTELRPQGAEVSTDSEVKSQARALRVEILPVSRLLQNLANFYRGWERILGTMSAGYTAAGDPAPVTRTGRLCCRG